jgi:hypothetical protein
MSYSERVPIRESDLPLYWENRQRTRGLLAPQIRACVVHTLQLPRECVPRIEWQMAVKSEELSGPAATRRQHSALKEGRWKSIKEF